MILYRYWVHVNSLQSILKKGNKVLKICLLTVLSKATCMKTHHLLQTMMTECLQKKVSFFNKKQKQCLLHNKKP